MPYHMAIYYDGEVSMPHSSAQTLARDNAWRKHKLFYVVSSDTKEGLNPKVKEALRELRKMPWRNKTAGTKSVVVIVSRCNTLGTQAWGGQLWHVSYPTLLAAIRIAASKRAPGMAVTIRPNYNEQDRKGKFFREWRSFNGEDFKECRWDIPAWSST